MRTLILLFISLSLSAGAQERILIKGGTLHVGEGTVINNSYIGIKDGKIELVANALITQLDESVYDTVINVYGKQVYPGFIAPNSTLGLVEIEAVRATDDKSEVGYFNPHIRSAIAYNVDSEVIPTVRSNGVLLAQITPRSGRISGTSSLMTLDGLTWEDALYKKDDGIHMNWPRMFYPGWWNDDGVVTRNGDYAKEAENLIAYLKKAKAYSETDHETTDLAMEAMRGLFDGSKRLFVHADFVKELEDIIAIKKELGIEHLVIVGGHDAWMVAELLQDQSIPVMLRRVHSLPMRAEEPVDLPYRLPSILQEAGVLFCLENSGDMEAMGTRNLPFYAGTAVAYGLSEEEAIASITLNTAKILGIDHKTGSIEQGKDANLVVSEGDALDVTGNEIVLAMIRGKFVDLDNKQKELYRKYMELYGLEEE